MFFDAGKEVQEFLTEQEMKEASLLSPEKFIGVIFKDSMSYHLRVPRQMIPESSSHLESKSKYIRYMRSFKKIEHYLAQFCAMLK